MATKTLVTTFDDVDEAEDAVRKLAQDGFRDGDLGWVYRSGGREIANGNLVEHHEREHKMGAAIGGLLGGLLGFLLGVTALTLIRVGGPTVIVVSLISAFAGVAIGAVVGRRIESYAHVEQPRPRAHRYAERLGRHAAAVMVTVSNEGEEARALEILRGEANLHQHPFVFRIPALGDEGRPSRPSLPSRPFMA